MPTTVRPSHCGDKLPEFSGPEMVEPLSPPTAAGGCEVGTLEEDDDDAKGADWLVAVIGVGKAIAKSATMQ